MRMPAKLTPAGSQTVGPYFRIGLQRLIEDAPAIEAAGIMTIQGRVLDRDRAPVPDAMLEFWSADRAGPADHNGFAQGFRRAATDIDGNFSMSMQRPTSLELEDGRKQAPHLLVLFFARGLLRHLITRVYLDEESANSSDPVLQG